MEESICCWAEEKMSVVASRVNISAEIIDDAGDYEAVTTVVPNQ